MRSLFLLCIFVHVALLCDSWMIRPWTENKKPKNDQNNIAHNKHEHLRRDSKYNPNRGVVLCAGNHMVGDALDVIEQTRNVFNSSINFAVMHCDELNADVVNKSFHSLKNVQVIDMCKGNVGLFNMTSAQTKKRLRTWFCKTAALVLSPFKETMVVDIDVVFLKQPDLLFNSAAYKRTGTLYMRDRVFFDRMALPENDTRLQFQIEEYIMAKSAAINGPYKVI